MLSFKRTSSRVQGMLCAIALLVAAAICHPVAEIGIYDDWSYVRTAQLLAKTGHIYYNGWATAMLGWQLVPAALCMRLFGVSFTTARLTTLAIAACTTFLMQRCFARCGLRAGNATVATLAVVFSPLFLPLATTYMSDVYGLLPIVACLYCCGRAVKADARYAGLWLVAASAVDVVGGTARQIAWLGLLVMVPCAVWLMRRRQGIPALGTACWVAGVGLIFASMRWFCNQPYAVPETFSDARLTGHVLETLGVNYVRLGLELGMLSLPLLLAFIPILGRSKRTSTVTSAGVALCCLIALVAHRVLHHLGQFFVPTLLDGGNYVSVEGVLTVWPELGTRPTLLTDPFRAVLTLVVVLGLVAVAVTVREKRRRVVPDEEQQTLSPKALLMLTVPFTLSYLLLLAPRSAFFHPYDRYCLPLVFVAALLLTRLYQGTSNVRLPRVTVVVLGVIGVYSVCATHDVFAMYRGTRRAIEEVLASGVPPTAVEAGWDFSGWTQITQDRFVHDPRLHLHGEESAAPVADGRACPFELKALFPAVDPLYALAFEPGLCGGEAPFAPVVFHTWLPWRVQPIYVVRNAPHSR